MIPLQGIREFWIVLFSTTIKALQAIIHNKQKKISTTSFTTIIDGPTGHFSYQPANWIELQNNFRFFEQ
jgi:frataxin-like iron-binding protein CyaY